ncbi:hypothetical protein [Citrobacter sp. UYEF32]|uniref:hypothetical protein n=1 Tax=Citrobacter sp. UYEF32 TaxID=3156347 RepID=UPI003395759B
MKPKVHEMKARKIPVMYKDEKGVTIFKEAVAFYDVESGDTVDPTKNDEYTEEEIKRMTDEAFERGESLD